MLSIFSGHLEDNIEISPGINFVRPEGWAVQRTESHRPKYELNHLGIHKINDLTLWLIPFEDLRISQTSDLSNLKEIIFSQYKNEAGMFKLMFKDYKMQGSEKITLANGAWTRFSFTETVTHPNNSQTTYFSNFIYRVLDRQVLTAVYSYSNSEWNADHLATLDEGRRVRVLEDLRIAVDTINREEKEIEAMVGSIALDQEKDKGGKKLSAADAGFDREAKYEAAGDGEKIKASVIFLVLVGVGVLIYKWGFKKNIGGYWQPSISYDPENSVKISTILSAEEIKRAQTLLEEAAILHQISSEAFFHSLHGILLSRLTENKIRHVDLIVKKSDEEKVQMILSDIVKDREVSSH